MSSIGMIDERFSISISLSNMAAPLWNTREFLNHLSF
jgi:hypothetical protein